jgi:hypothetical protein
VWTGGDCWKIANSYRRETMPRAMPHTGKMTKSTKNLGKPWTQQDIQMLRQLANENTPTRVMGLKLGRTEASVRSKAKSEGISLKPTNQSPFG